MYTEHEGATDDPERIVGMDLLPVMFIAGTTLGQPVLACQGLCVLFFTRTAWVWRGGSV